MLYICEGEILVEKSPSPKPESATEDESAILVKHNNHYIEVEVNLSAPGIIVLSEIDYPGWTASANGNTIENLRAFGLLRAVSLPKGTWTIVWKYSPISIYIGLIVYRFYIGLIIYRFYIGLIIY